MWREYISLLIQMNNEGRLKYASAYPGNPTSLKFYKNTLYVDCWGLIKAGAKLILTQDAASELVLDGPVNSIYRRMRETGEIAVVRTESSVYYPNLRTGYTIFIDNRKEEVDKKGTISWTGYDHCMTYIEDMTWVNEFGVPMYLRHALVGISSDGLQIYDMDLFLPLWEARGYPMRWANQLHIDYGDLILDDDEESEGSDSLFGELQITPITPQGEE